MGDHQNIRWKGLTLSFQISPIYPYIPPYNLTDIHTYIHTYIHTHIHTQIYIYICISLSIYIHMYIYILYSYAYLCPGIENKLCAIGLARHRQTVQGLGFSM